MRYVKVINRSTETIVQQTNVLSTKDVLRQLSTGSPLDLNPGSQNRSFDFDDQTQVDHDAPRFDGFESLIDQSINKQKILDHIHPSSPAPAADPSPAPAADPSPVPSAE